MKFLTRLGSFGFLFLFLAASLPTTVTAAEDGFVSLFDGKSLKGWKLIGKKGEGYGAKDGVLFCAKGGGGKLITEKEYSDFVLRFEFKLAPGANNGLGIRAPEQGDAAYLGMELQIIDNRHPKWARLQPWQYHGSIYNVVPAKRGSLKEAGEWNVQEVTAMGRRIRITLNGDTIIDTDLNDVTDAKTLMKHPGILRESGHIGFLGHGDHAEFRNIRIMEFPRGNDDNSPPTGFTALFNGKDLDGWKGLPKGPFNSPAKRAAASKEEVAAAQELADESMREHWKVKKGELEFDGKGQSLVAAKDYANFELLVDWKIKEAADSGIYLRGSPQVQIWDPFSGKSDNTKVGSGGLFNNKLPKNSSKPLAVADNPIGEWNQFRILMTGERVHIFLNGKLVVKNTVLENYWERDKPIYPSGQIELQNHGNTLWFKNVYIRELP
jgi:hypothetical protein